MFSLNWDYLMIKHHLIKHEKMWITNQYSTFSDLHYNIIQKFMRQFWSFSWKLPGIKLHSKICYEMYGFQDKCPTSHTFVSKFFKFLNGCILFNIGPIDMKLEDFVKLGVLFPNIWSWVVNPIIHALIPRPSRYEIWQWGKEVRFLITTSLTLKCPLVQI